MADFGSESAVLGSGTDGSSRKCEGEAGVSGLEGSGSCEAEGSSVELLKNTPSNIARLEDQIEHCEERQKYLAQTRSPSDGSDVRWYFCKIPLAENELAASLPSTEIVGKSDYFRFGMRDSLAIEASFLQREEELLSSWWREYAECSEGPKERPKSGTNSDLKLKASSSENARPAQLYEVEEERVGVPVKGGLYEVDLVKRHCFPIYWNGENRRVLRGHWFARKGGLDWLPLREDVAEQLEFAYRGQVWHRRTFQPSGLFAARIDLQGSTPGLHALFTGEDDTWEAWLNVDASGFSSVISLSGNGIKLRRGYSPSLSPKPTQDELRQQKEEEMDDYCSQWRRGLKLSGESTVEKITLDGVRGLRVTLSATVHDVLYYMSPIYCQDIINSVSNQLNRLYLKFLKRNPGYDGKVSIYGHSLGSVLSYDILCHQDNLSSPFPMDATYIEQTSKEENPPSGSNQSSTYNSSTNLENSSLINDTQDMVVPNNEDKMISQPSVVVCGEELAEPSVTADLEEPSIMAMDSNQPNDSSSLNESVHEQVCDSSDMFCQEKDGMNEDIGTNDRGIPNGVSEKTPEELFDDTSNKDEECKLLREEIASLKARIAELECQCGGNEEGHKAIPKQPFYERVPTGQDVAPRNYTPYIKYTKLEFKVDTFFAVGSPLGVFLALRNIRIGIGKGQDYWGEENISEEMPSCRQMFNIFHPFDPVAYRIEPLICKEYIGTRPVIIPYHKGGKRLHIGLQDFAEDLAARSQAIMDHLQSVRVKVLTVCQSKNRNDLEDEVENYQEKDERSYGSIMLERLTGSEDGRVDHMLQDKTFEHAYISAIGSHTNYWRDYDTALFILKHLYRDIPEEPSSSEEANGGSSKNENGSTGWTDQREAADEELPLTFAERIVIRNFSRKAKKIMKS
ncbi:hypothetical protein PVL29_024946 [Vitis rotundifolia]|uniref:DDHD domain-containing protein n=1 Tax=Vitis rotundifolia TaxID=103349 RepID=A0AA38YTE8_VITRO|nr:hypothetical protein PVL29_024946 [Vitis rotundifolia]